MSDNKAVAQEVEGQEEGEESAEPEEGPEVDTPLAEEAAYPTKVCTARCGLPAACLVRQHATVMQHINWARMVLVAGLMWDGLWQCRQCLAIYPLCIYLAQCAWALPVPLVTKMLYVQAGKKTSAKRSAGDAAAQEAVDDMLAEQEGEGDSDDAPEEAAEEAEEEDEDLDDAGAETA